MKIKLLVVLTMGLLCRLAVAGDTAGGVATTAQAIVRRRRR